MLSTWTTPLVTGGGVGDGGFTGTGEAAATAGLGTGGAFLRFHRTMSAVVSTMRNRTSPIPPSARVIIERRPSGRTGAVSVIRTSSSGGGGGGSVGKGGSTD